MIELFDKDDDERIQNLAIYFANQFRDMDENMNTQLIMEVYNCKLNYYIKFFAGQCRMEGINAPNKCVPCYWGEDKDMNLLLKLLLLYKAYIYLSLLVIKLAAY